MGNQPDSTGRRAVYPVRLHTWEKDALEKLAEALGMSFPVFLRKLAAASYTQGENAPRLIETFKTIFTK